MKKREEDDGGDGKNEERGKELRKEIEAREKG